jgi:hypothetical protein
LAISGDFSLPGDRKKTAKRPLFVRNFSDRFVVFIYPIVLFPARIPRMCAMYECRCPHDGKKLAEIARPPLALGHYHYPCECGRWVRGQIIMEPGTNSINRIISLAGSNEDIDIEPDIPDAYVLLDDLVQRRVITQADKKIILATVIEGKSLKDISDPGHYEKLKKRRQRTIRTIETHLANKLKL